MPNNPFNPIPPYTNENSPTTPNNNNPNVFPSNNTGIPTTAEIPQNTTLPAIYNNTKGSVGSVFPEKADWSWPYSRVEPLITPEQVRLRFLFGIPLYSNQKNPITGNRAYITDELLRDEFIPRGVMQAETAAHISIFPLQKTEKHPFDKAAYEAFGYMLSESKPILSIEKLSITPSNNIDVYIVPMQWVETNGFARGQINIVPLTAAFQGAGFLPPSQSAGGAAFLQILGSKNWIPYYWQLQYTTGFPSDSIPILINELVGNFVAKNILEMLAATNKVPSYSLGVDGVSQQVNVTGTTVYKERLEQIEKEIESLINRIQKYFSITMFATNI